MTQLLSGEVDNGRRAILASSLFSGEVGVRDRGGGQLELAWFGRTPSFRTAIAGALDVAPITITDLRSRPINSSRSLVLQASAVSAIIATATRPVSAAEPTDL